MKLARVLLAASCGREVAEVVAGDLEEEYALICAGRGRTAAARWYTSQVVRSVVPLSGLWIRAAMLDLICVAAPVISLDRLWRFVYSQIPLKDAPVRDTTAYLVCMSLLVVAGGGLVWRKSR